MWLKIHPLRHSTQTPTIVGVRQLRGISTLTYQRLWDLPALTAKSPPCRIFKQLCARFAAKLANRGHNLSHSWPQWLTNFLWQSMVETYLNNQFTVRLPQWPFLLSYHMPSNILCHVNKDEIYPHFIRKLQTMISAKALQKHYLNPYNFNICL